MDEHTLILRLRERVTEEAKKKETETGNGAAVSFSDYRERVGYLRGLRDALKLANEIFGDIYR